MVTNFYFDTKTNVVYLKIMGKFHKYRLLLWELKPKNTLRFCCDPVKEVYNIITFFKIRTNVSYLENIYKFGYNGSIFTWLLAKTNVQIYKH